MALVLLVLPSVLAWLLVRHHHLDLGTAVAVVAGAAAASAAFPVAWLTWAMYRDAKKSAPQADQLTLAQVADQLAVAVGAQWEVEAAIRRLNDPYPLPVSWVAADPSLTDAWDSLVTLASSGAGWPATVSSDAWAAGPEGLAGEGSDLVSVLGRVPTGRLVVLGEPGAGKTMLMVRLVLDLLARRAAGGAIPIMVSLASWNPAEQDLRGWHAAQLIIDYPALANPPPGGVAQPTQAAALLASGLILPVLDGLDEIPSEIRGPAISRINDALRPSERVVATCRNQEYEEAVRPQAGVEVTLRGATAVQLCPLDADVIRAYLCDDAGGPVARARWNPVLKTLGTEVPSGQVLNTPLMISLARAIYNPRPGELAGALRDPAELCNPALADRAEVEALLFDALIPAAYRYEPVGRWPAQKAEKWLAFLARHLEHTIVGPDLAWWQLLLSLPSFPPAVALPTGILAGAMGGTVVGFVLGIMIVVATGILSASSGAATVAADVAATVVFVGIVIGATIGAGASLMVQRSAKPSAGIHWQLLRPGDVAFGALFGIAFGVVAGIRGGGVAGIVVAVVVWTGALIWSWLVDQLGASLDISSAASPLAVLQRDRRAATALGVVMAIGTCLLAAILIGFMEIDKLVTGGSGAAVGILALLALGAGVFRSFNAAWPGYEIARIWLALRRRLPWHVIGFLEDAHKRGVLRQAGAVYQFRHIELQHRLATRPAKSAGVPEAPGSESIVAPDALP